MNDLIADMLARIKNGYLARKKLVDLPFSKINQTIAKIMVKNGYLKKVRVKSKDLKFKVLEVKLKYENKLPAITEIKRVSKPGRRVYKAAKKLRSVNFGLGIVIISTSAGLMVGKQARKRSLGGEIICEMW